MSVSFVYPEQAPLSAGAVQDITNETEQLRRHLGLGKSPGMPPSSTPPVCIPLVFIERAPSALRGASCKMPSCLDRIEPGQYRIALNPGMSGMRSSSQNPVLDFYHVACFEKIADLFQADFLDRIQPVTRRYLHLRNLKGNDVADGDYLCDGGAERLILEWKTQRGVWIDERDGAEAEKATLNPAFENLLQRAGSSTFTFQSVPDLTTHEYRLLSESLAPFESDGPDDTQEWNLFESYLNAHDAKESLYERHNLSNMLNRWKHDVVLARSDDRTLADEERRAKAQLGEKAIRAIQRLSAIPMPDFQSASLGRRI